MNELELRNAAEAKGFSIFGERPVSEKAEDLLKIIKLVIHPKNISDRTTFRNVVCFYRDQCIKLEADPTEIFRRIIDAALEASGPKSHNPAAVFMSILRKEFGYSGKTKQDR